MVTVFKWTNADGHVDYPEEPQRWGLGVTHLSQGIKSAKGPRYIPTYETAELAVLLDSHYHGPLKGSDKVEANPLLWECEGIIATDFMDGRKDCHALTSLHPVAIPEIDIVSTVIFGILCVQTASYDPYWLEWAEIWLNYQDRSTAYAHSTLFHFSDTYHCDVDYASMLMTKAALLLNGRTYLQNTSLGMAWTGLEEDRQRTIRMLVQEAAMLCAHYACDNDIPFPIADLASKAIVGKARHATG